MSKFIFGIKFEYCFDAFLILSQSKDFKSDVNTSLPIVP